MADFDTFINSIIADGNDGKAFEVFCKHFLETSPDYRDQFETVWLWDKFPHKWSKDKGVDLIAKYKGREKYCAIQAKCYAAHNTVPYNEVTNFLADSNRVEIEDRILMMSTNKLNEKTSKEVIAGQEKQVIIRDRQYFESVNYDYPSHISELSKAKEKPKAKPREHQRAAIDDVEKGLKDNDRGQLIMACGTGKTFTTLWVKERLQANTALVLLPSLSLLSQTMREWVWGANDKFEALAVCSDPTVGKSKNPEEDISNAEVGKVTWHVDEIRSFLKSESPKVIFCTYQSSELIQEAQEDESIPQFDLVVCDEAHRCAGKANAGFATVLHDDKIRAKKRLFTTATPRYYGKSVQSAAEGRGVEIIGMDDEAKFGPVVHKLTFGQAIEMDMLTDYQVVVVGVDEPMVREWIAEGEIVSYGDDNQTDARTLAAKIAVLKAIRDYDLKRVISFHNNISRAKDFASDVFDVAEIIANEHRPEGKIWSRHVDGKMSAGTRRDLINGLKDLDGYDIGMLTNARCLSEGVDVPSLDGVAFVDPRGSQVDIIQAVGRAIRKSDNKNKGTIVLPVFLEAGDDPDSVIDASNFKPVWDVLKALRSHDEELADTLDQYRTDMGLGITRTSDRIEKIVFDLPIHLDTSFSSMLQTRLVEATSENWYHWFGLLAAYTRETGHSSPQANFETEGGYKLGRWLVKQRQEEATMRPERRELLEKLDGWVWSPRDALWEFGFKAYKEFVSQNNSVLVNIDYETNDGYKLGVWVRTQRTHWSELSDERRNLLTSVGFSLDPDGDRWNLQYKNYLEEFNAKGSHEALCEENKKWASTQRGRYGKSLDKDQVERLQLLEGWVWDKKSSNWEKNYYALQEFVDEFGHADVPHKYSRNGIKLGLWVNSIRGRRDCQTGPREERLNRLGFVWNTREANWLKYFNLLKKYKEEFNTLEVPKSTIFQGDKLGVWVYIQRRDQNKMTAERRKLLNDLGFNFQNRNYLEDQWAVYFEAASIFKHREGHLLVKRGHIECGLDLATWIFTQRGNFAKNKLDANRIAKLNELGMVWNVLEHNFNVAVDALHKFKKREGHVEVPQKHKEDGYPLGTWVSKRKNRWEQMNDNHKNRLLELGLKPSKS